MPAAEPTAPASGFAANAARLLDAARANERAVRDLDEATQLLAGGMEELARVEGLAEELAGLEEQTGRAAEAAEELRGAVAAVEGIAGAAHAAREASERAGELLERTESLAGRVEQLEGRLAELDGRLGAALEHVEALDLPATLARLEAVEGALDRVEALLARGADTYVERFEGRIAELEQVAERMDWPSMADELADVLACTRRVLELAGRPASA